MVYLIFFIFVNALLSRNNKFGLMTMIIDLPINYLISIIILTFLIVDLVFFFIFSTLTIV